jgi:hypothetical protein
VLAKPAAGRATLPPAALRPPSGWDASQLTAMRGLYPDTLAVQHFTRQATPGALHDVDG